MAVTFLDKFSDNRTPHLQIYDAINQKYTDVKFILPLSWRLFGANRLQMQPLTATMRVDRCL